MHSIRSFIAAALSSALLAALALPAHAQTDPKFAYGTKEEAADLDKAKEVEWKAAAQAGLILLTGNSRVTTFAAGANASRKANKNKFSLEAGAAYARSSIFLAQDDGDGAIEEDEITRSSQTTSRSWMVKGRYDRYLTENDALYAAAGLFADRPAGKDLVANGQVGYSRQLYKDDVHLLLGEAGYDFSHENLAVGDSLSIHSLRVFGGYGLKVSEDTALDSSIEALFNVNEIDTVTGEVSAFEDNRVLGRLALTTQLINAVSLRFAFEGKFDNAPAPRPPLALPYADGFVPLADELDTKTEVSLIVSFL